MTWLRSTTIPLAFAGAALMGLAGVASAHPDDACTRFDEASAGGCANCVKREWTGHDWRLVDTCRAGYRLLSSDDREKGGF